ncbi:MAG: type II toxin-antitoxin system HicB family antitoxin [Synergistaceae bacterium]|nr:type II toxin-antitoxin system HicB family antitoxin [Synergistaceae bacterium]
MAANDHYIFPAVFYNDEGAISVEFPDLPGCLTFGDDMNDAVSMAKDALGGYLLTMQDIHGTIPQPTPFNEVKLHEGQAVFLVEVYLSILRDEEKNKSVKKTVTLPNWLNVAAMDANVNFSSVLQEALRSRLGV